MDPAGLAIGIAALYTACRDCYDFFTTAKTAEAESSAHRRELEIQQSILKAWGFHWQIHNEDDSEPEHSDNAGRKRTKLHEYLLSNRFKAEGVFKTLSALADTLSNQDKLVKRYGIQLQPAQAIQDASQLTIQNTTIEDVKPVISEVRNRLSVLNKLKWALKDKDNFKKLIADLRSHSESLYRLCPENAFESMNIYLTMECLARQESPAGLKWTSKLATQFAEFDQESSVREGYKLLASAASLKASVNENRGRAQADGKALSIVDEMQPKMWHLGKGLALFEEQVVYVEMRDYRGPPLELTPQQKQQLKRRRNRERFLASLSMGDMTTRHYSKAGMNQIYEYSSDEAEDVEPIEIVRPADPKLRALIRNFFNTFQGANRMKSVYGLDIAGMIDHTEGEHKGHCSILYRLPGTIGVQSRERPAENLKIRAPVTLQSLLGTKQKRGIRSMLGARFELARKIVRAVCLLHSSGWLHKNIRAESVMFFPEHVDKLQDDLYEVKIEIDVSKPLLMGYIFSRPDDIIIRMNPPSAPQTEQQSPKPCNPRRNHPTEFSRTWDDPFQEGSESKRGMGPPRADSIYGRNMLEKAAVTKQTKETNISGFTLDYYQHPAKHADPKRLYRHAYDVYSLGILLLEVGLWEKLKNYEDSCLWYIESTDYDEEDHYERRRWICREYLDRLRWACGNTYADVVLSCLMIDSSDDEVSKASERELCARIVADLEGCQA
ncbi:prion-inhibition and propagation-domain-containing protein [Dactylonectria macrodidyma]|uniref:Prion-inhibition and propagation-domain-containing protein n=1 Tax=Dactylonectria macrodidyma TaxID=307937 RepID=A0A9P9E045_9HYPO|nr:prion-inhibition and propagation-domain-containing protein [Dactylonectria macrodidyma]